jgi:hypothetical protein
MKKGLLVFILFAAKSAFGTQSYQLSLTNGSSMPISAGVVYVTEDQKSLTQIGDTPTQGLINLCQMGDPTLELAEVKGNKSVSLALTSGGIMPGQTITVPVNVPNPSNESVHFIAMYGKSKEACASVWIESQNLLDREHSGTDNVISAGAATEPMIISSTNLQSICQTAPGAIDCLRNLTSARASGAQIHSFAGYLPSVLNFLEVKYGPEDVLTLFIPQAGAVNYTIKRN